MQLWWFEQVLTTARPDAWASGRSTVWAMRRRDARSLISLFLSFSIVSQIPPARISRISVLP